MPTDRQRFAHLLRAHHPLVAITTAEEDRVVEAVVGAAVDCARPINTWTVVRGVYEGVFDTDHHAEAGTEQPAAALRWCWQAGGGRVFIFCDLAAHLGNEVVVRALRELVARCATLGGSVVLVDHQDALSEVVRREAVAFTPGLPDDQEILQLIRETVAVLKRDAPLTVELPKEEVAKAIKALRGLTRSQARRLVADAMAADDRFDAAGSRRRRPAPRTRPFRSRPGHRPAASRGAGARSGPRRRRGRRSAASSTSTMRSA
jgi:hypothetical protein